MIDREEEFWRANQPYRYCDAWICYYGLFLCRSVCWLTLGKEANT
jgi:hypothetical protein